MTPEEHTRTGLRERKKAATRRAIQAAALGLFLAQGYEATTVGEIAAAANVSPMTFFRYFPTKEDVVIADEYDPLLAAALAASPPGEPIIARIRRAVGAGLATVYAADRAALLQRTRLILHTPALRARLWEQQRATEALIASALAAPADPGDALATRVAIAAGLATLTTALAYWVDGEGAEELPTLIERAFAALQASQEGTA